MSELVSWVGSGALRSEGREVSGYGGAEWKLMPVNRTGEGLVGWRVGPKTEMELHLGFSIER